MNPTKTNTMNPIKAITQKNRHKSPLRRPGAALAPIRQKAAATSLQSSAWPFRPAGGDKPAGNHGSEAQSGKTAENPAAGGPESAAAGSPPAAAPAAAPEAGYWTVLRGAGMEDDSNEATVSELFDCRFGLVDDLCDALRRKKWTPELFAEQRCRFARVVPTERGFNTILFPSYAAAADDDQAREESAARFAKLAAMVPDPARPAAEVAAEIAELAAEALAAVPDLKPCPFCRKRDRLQIIGWSHERHDYTEFTGDAVRCNRCDCVVSLAAWQGRTEVKP